MPSAYDPTSPAGQVRLLANDTNPADYLFTDAEITAFLTLDGQNVKRAAAQAIDTIADNEALVAKVITDHDLTMDGAQVIDRTLDSVVRIGLPATGEPVWDPVLEHTVPPQGTTVYSGPASLVKITDTARELTVVDQKVAVRTYQVTIRYCAEAILEEHVVDVVSSPDADLVGARLTMSAVERGSRRFSRVLQAVLAPNVSA